MRRTLTALAAAAALTLPSAPASASVQTVVAGPGAYAANFLTPVVIVSKSAPLRFVNADILAHNVEATSTFGPDTNYWCEQFPVGRCPLFWSPWIASAQSTVVDGLEATQVGRTYAFRCAPHPSTMNGIMVVVP